MEPRNNGSGDKHDSDDDDALSDYILLVLSDSNLPTGGFVASSGLESYWAHGLMAMRSHASAAKSTMADELVRFIAFSLDTYASTVAGYLLDGFRLTHTYMHDNAISLDDTAAALRTLDLALHSMMLNHVAQRASKAQGVALLTLYAKSFATDSSTSNERATRLLQQIKLDIRRGVCHGHLPVCWAAFIAAVGITNARRALAVHLFLQARAILSSAVRLNIVGPYLSHRLLAFEVHTLIKDSVARACSHTTGLLVKPQQSAQAKQDEEKAHLPFDWTWNADESESTHSAWDVMLDRAPKTTWPLGDLLQARHDQLHSRLFNS